MERRKEKEKRGSCGGVIAALFVAAAILILIPKVREIYAVVNGSATEQTAETIRKYLGDYVEPDTRIIFASSGNTDEEMLKAVQNREKQICVVGGLASGEGYVNNPYSGAGYDGSVFRTMPYSSFWMESYEAYSGTFSLGLLGKTLFEKEFYTFSFSYYDLSEDDIERMKTEIDQAADDILAQIPPDADLWQTCRTVHDELIKRTAYDHDLEDHCHDLYGALVKRRAVCEGYALAFRYILNRAGENCDVVVSDWDENSEAVSHAWNQIYAPTYERYIDVTWDDTDRPDSSGEQEVAYDYFGLTAEEISAVEDHDFESRDPYEIEEPVAFNYYRHEGYLLTEYDPYAVAACFVRQYETGTSSLTVRFEDRQVYQEAYSRLFGGQEITPVFEQLGYYGPYWYSKNDDMCTITVGLGESRS